MFKSLAATAFFAAVITPSAFAQAFTPEDVDQFAATLEDLQESSAASEVTAELPSMPEPSAMMMGRAIELPELPVDDEGRLAILRNSIGNAPENSPEMDEAISIIHAHGYSDLMEYATEGDYIMAAYMAFKMEGQGPDLSGMDMSQLDQLPPAMKARLEPVLNWMSGMVAMIDAVPEEEVAIIASKRAVLEAAMED